MSMVKTGVVASPETIDIIGASSNNNNINVCDDCKKIVMSSQIQQDGSCPFCQSKNLHNKERQES